MLALGLAGCAGAPPVTADTAPSCDLICTVLRLLDIGSPPSPPREAPPPSAALPPMPPPKPKIQRRARPLGQRPPRETAEPAPASLPPGDGAPEPPRAPAAGLLPPDEASGPAVMSGSPGIAPPWFEPWPGH